MSVIELRYIGRNFVYLFDCDWWDTGSSSGLKREQGFTIVNTSHKWYESDPFILACQAAQVFYLNDPKLGGSWKVAQTLTNRNIYYIPTTVDEDNEDNDQGIHDEAYQESVCVRGDIAIVEESTIFCRDDTTIAIDGLYVQLDGPNLLVDDNPLVEENEINSDDEEELCSDYDTESEDAEYSENEQSSQATNDTNSDDDMC
jgi:hypothetical protein